MFEAIFKRSNVKSSIQSLSWMPEAAMEKRKERSANVLVGGRLFFFFHAASRLAFAGFKEKKASVSKQTFCEGFSGLIESRRRTTRIRFN